MAKLSKPQKTKEVQSVKMDPLLEASPDVIVSGLFFLPTSRKRPKGNLPALSFRKQPSLPGTWTTVERSLAIGD